MPNDHVLKIWMPIIEAFPNDKVKSPKIPIENFCAEAEELAVVAINDKRELLAAGLNWDNVESLKPLSLALRYCQAEWIAISGEMSTRSSG